MRHTQKNLENKEKGAALIFFVTIVSLVIMIFTFNTLNGKQLEALKKDKTAKALFDARNALLGWSVMRGISGAVTTATPGQLPCPEDLSLIGTPNEGNASSTCSNTATLVGRLPWRSLGLGDIRDGNNDKLWYAISPGFRSAPLNANNLGQLSIDGNINAAVAIIFSPGFTLSGQNRAVIATPNFLDLSNNDGNNSFITTGLVGSFNDSSIAVTKDELFKLIAKRILREIRGDNTQGLVRYYATQGASNYPFADINNDGSADAGELTGTPSYEGSSNAGPNNLFFNTRIKTILVNNKWMQLIDYQISPDKQLTNLTLNNQSLTVSP